MRYSILKARIEALLAPQRVRKHSFVIVEGLDVARQSGTLPEVNAGSYSFTMVFPGKAENEHIENPAAEESTSFNGCPKED